jgi:hypothetical protein
MPSSRHPRWDNTPRLSKDDMEKLQLVVPHGMIPNEKDC